ncbi:MAG: hypothetical protein GF384_06115, partial [Elusimicrobia bacterium]|nr:hypothetical protein [Elusimicrobiota bacterium]MBD3412308.1 hypothetical protein [Elusimicrobiota bacterium]
MILWDLMVALAVGVILTIVFSQIFRKRGPWESLLVFFLIVFFGAWAGGVWFRPFGPLFLGRYWIPFTV